MNPPSVTMPAAACRPRHCCFVSLARASARPALRNSFARGQFPEQERSMLNRLSVNALLKSIIVALSAVVVVVLSLGAWESWHRMAVASRIAAAAEASTHLFTALHNLRVDRSSTNRDLLSDRQLTELSPHVECERAMLKCPPSRQVSLSLANTTFPEKDSCDCRPRSGDQEPDGAAARIGRCVPAAEIGASSGHRAGILPAFDNTIDLLDKILSQLTRSAEARRRIYRPVDGAQAACMDGA